MSFAIWLFQNQNCIFELLNLDNGNNIVYKISEPEYVNERRQEIGLKPIEEYLSKWNIERKVYQKNYK